MSLILKVIAALLSSVILIYSSVFSQESPTLAVGLETLTFKKGNIDVEALTAIIMKKQRELKHEALRRFMLKMFPESNYTTKFYVQNCLNILLYETNPQVIEKEILELTTNYALAIGIASIYSVHPDFSSINSCYAVYSASPGGKLANLLGEKKNKSKIEDLNKKLSAVDNLIKQQLSTHESLLDVKKKNQILDHLKQLKTDKEKLE